MKGRRGLRSRGWKTPTFRERGKGPDLAKKSENCSHRKWEKLGQAVSRKTAEKSILRKS